MLSVDSAGLRPVQADLALHFEYESIASRYCVLDPFALERFADQYRDRLNRSMDSLLITIEFYHSKFVRVNRSML